MILADKIITLRKKNGWSQEEFAEKLGVSRQSVSKWEGAQSTPDLERILQMAKLFQVSTDYLLKDELENEDAGGIPAEDDTPTLRRISMEEANRYLETVKRCAPRTALAVMLYILSPIPLLLLGGLTERIPPFISENIAAGIGVPVLLIMVALATVMLVWCGAETKPYDYLETEDIDTEYGVAGMVGERRKQYEMTDRRNSMLGIALCILAAIPAICVGFLPEELGLGGAAVSLTLFMVAAAVRMFVSAGIISESHKKLLEKGDFSRSKKQYRRTSRLGDVSGIYWILAAAIYLAWSFMTDSWDKSWVLWPIAGVLYAAFAAIWEMAERKNGK